MIEELTAISKELMYPFGKRLLRCKWVFDYKLDIEKGCLLKFKARLVAIGQQQEEYGVDYKETFAPVIRKETLRMMIALSEIMDWHIAQMDVSVAFLYGDLTERNYMYCPEGFPQFDENGESLVCEIYRSLYGLHQSAREWNNVLTKYLVENGFIQSVKDNCLFHKFDKERKVFIMVYVDDLLFLSSSKELIEQLKKLMKNQFEVKDLGEAKHIIGIQYEKIKNVSFKGSWIGQQNTQEIF